MFKLSATFYLLIFIVFVNLEAKSSSVLNRKNRSNIKTQSRKGSIFFSLTNGFVKSSTARVYIKSSTHVGKVYWVIYSKSEAVPDPVKIQNKVGALFSGNIDFQTLGVMDFFHVKGLKPNTAYTVYATMESVTGQLGGVSSTTFTTKVFKAPQLDSQIDAVNGVLKRLLPNNSNDFILKAIPPVDDTRDVFEISTSQGKVIVKGSSATAITSGIRYYLGEYCKLVSLGMELLLLPQK